MAKKTPTRSTKSKAARKKAPVKKKTVVAKKKAPVKKTATKKTTKKAVTKKAAAKKTTRKAAPKKKAAVKKTPAKKVSTKKTPKKVAKKATPVKKTAAKKAATTRGKKTAAPPAATKKSVKKTPSKKTAAKPAAAKKTTAKKSAAPKATAKAGKPAAKKTATRGLLKGRLSTKGKASKSASIGFSLDEVKEIAKQSAADEAAVAKKKADNAKEKAAALEAQLKAAKPSKVAAASLADILGFNPAGSKKKSAYDDPSEVPAKWRKYFKLLIELRTHLTGQIDQHSEETLKRSSKDDAGDLSSYGQHMADAGTDTFDRDFALSLVANEQEALAEIEAAITRIKNGTYGVCEVTGEPIDKDRLAAVPFTRYSAAAQKELERNRHRVRTQAGLGAEAGDTVAIADPNADE